jgi:hypothetical protein
VQQHKQQQLVQEEVQDEERVAEKPARVLSPASTSEFPSDQWIAMQAALTDLASQHCLNTRSFRDMVLPSPVSLPITAQTEIMSIRFNPGFFEVSNGWNPTTLLMQIAKQYILVCMCLLLLAGK